MVVAAIPSVSRRTAIPLDYEETEKLHEELNALFDVRIKDRVDASVQRLIPAIDKAIQSHIESRLRNPTSWVSPEMGGELAKWIRQQAESAADHYIRLFGGAPALREIVSKLWDAKSEEYIQQEVDRRLRDIMKKLSAVVPST